MSLTAIPAHRLRHYHGHERDTCDANREAIVHLPRKDAGETTVVRTGKPFPRNRPDLEIEGFTLRPEAFDDEIYLVPEYADDLLPGDLITVDDRTMTSPERTLLDFATCTTGADLWRMLDNALAIRLITVESLRKAIARHQRHRGRNRLATFLDTWSDCES
jgi:hypothetical protein